METPLVSVIVPVYNAQRYLTQCVESLLAQTLKNCQFIFVDDGSKDDSLAILRQFEKQDARIEVYTQQNAFAGAARNLGITLAKGKYVTFLDSDDLMAPQALELLYHRAEECQADLVLCQAEIFTFDLQKRHPHETALKLRWLPQAPVFSWRDCPETIFQITVGMPWAKLYRRSMMLEENIRFSALPRSEDIIVVIASLVAARRITTVQEPLIYYRIEPGNGSLEDSRDRYPLTSLMADKEAYDLMKARGLHETLHRSFVNYVMTQCLFSIRSFGQPEALRQYMAYLENETLPYLQIDLDREDYFLDPEWARTLKRELKDKTAKFFWRQRKMEKALLAPPAWINGLPLLRKIRTACLLLWGMGVKGSWKLVKGKLTGK